ncbi:MAG: hypothetical protein II117_02555 [Clostridia bacterium]|nr:hypothetical protein [Clostridia bacterium]
MKPGRQDRKRLKTGGTVHQKDLYQYLLRFCVKWSIPVLVIIIMCIRAGSKEMTQSGMNEPDWNEDYEIRSMDTTVELAPDGSAVITDVWQFNAHRENATFGVSLKTGNTALEVDSFSLSVNGQAFIGTENRKLRSGEFRLDNDAVYWRYGDSGKLTAELKYRIPAFVSDRNGSAALTFKSPGTYSNRIGKGTVSIGMEGKDLSRNAQFSGAGGFRGRAGFVGTAYRAETFDCLTSKDYMEIQLLLPLEFFDSLSPYNGPDDSFQFNRLRYKTMSVFQRPVGWTLGAVSRVASVAAAILGGAIVLQLGFNLYWVQSRKRDKADAPDISEINRRHWKRHLILTLILSIALLFALFLWHYSIGMHFLYGLIPLGIITFIIGQAMVLGLSMLSKTDKLL